MRMGSGKVYSPNGDDSINALLKVIFPPLPDQGGVLGSQAPVFVQASPAALSFTI